MNEEAYNPCGDMGRGGNINMELPGVPMEAVSWKRMLLLYESALEVINTKINVLNREFVLRFGYTPIEHINSRIKSPQSILRKLKINHREPLIGNVVRYINDIAGIMSCLRIGKAPVISWQYIHDTVPGYCFQHNRRGRC